MRRYVQNDAAIYIILVIISNISWYLYYWIYRLGILWLWVKQYDPFHQRQHGNQVHTICILLWITKLHMKTVQWNISICVILQKMVTIVVSKQHLIDWIYYSVFTQNTIIKLYYILYNIWTKHRLTFDANKLFTLSYDTFFRFISR